MNRAALERHIRATPVEGSPAEMRAAFLRLAHPEGVPDLPPLTQVGGCEGRWFGTDGAPILWLHGGGYVFGGSDSHAAPAAALARIAGRRVFVPDYPLAPEHPWPAPLDATAPILDALPDCDVVGDSAGGHLALVLAMTHPGRIRRLALLSPNTDRSGCSITRVRNGDTDLMNDDTQDRSLSDMALGHLADTDPHASPLLGDLSRLPPVWITATTTEVLLDDSLLLATAAARAGVTVTLEVPKRLFHMWHLWPDATPQGHATLHAIARHFA
ncbi:Acetyl esterase/lipase [Loktanella fryxellensis]|uniref:Acetyl esterase/lipase n=1 Tax=Loktanella fryxellensis TaxID=245187 RepID=A0A1H8EE43_9RHOB|nr:alpha/beta hydrolase fold domain-containing protein [Loktanella fryxellensis]SEN17782.1 Acetyl esterase/lipase [Loktanella fryxellensis]